MLRTIQIKIPLHIFRPLTTTQLESKCLSLHFHTHSWSDPQQPNNPDAQIEQVISIFADLMKDAPGAMTFSGGDRTLFPLSCAAAIRSSLVSGAEFYVAFTTSATTSSTTHRLGEIAGFSVWMPPGVDISPEGTKILEEYKEKLPPEGERYYMNMVTTLAGLITNTFGPTATHDDWVCSPVMTRKEYQGRGILSTLFKVVIDKATAAKRRIRLYTSIDGNIPIYQSLGLTLHSSVKIESPLEPAFSFHLFSKEPDP